MYPTVSTKPSTITVLVLNQPAVYLKKKCMFKVKIVDGSDSENNMLLQKMVEEGQIEPLPKMNNW